MTLDEAVIQSNKALEHWGWCSLEKAQEIIRIMDRIQPKLSVESGVFGGKSFVPITLWHKRNGGKAIGIDPWTQEAAAESYSGANADWWLHESRLEEAMRMCQMTLQNLGCEGAYELHRCKSAEYPLLPDTVIDLWHEDGNHAAPVIEAVKKFAPQVRVGGVIIMDDLNWFNDDKCHVGEAAALLPSMGFVELYKLDTGAVFERKECQN